MDNLPQVQHAQRVPILAHALKSVRDSDHILWVLLGRQQWGEQWQWSTVKNDVYFLKNNKIIFKEFNVSAMDIFFYNK